jgi:uncharacterized membrane protein
MVVVEVAWERMARTPRYAVRAAQSAWARWCRYDFTGLSIAVAFFCMSLTPSLLPRGPLLQGVISGISTTIGYAVGVLVGFLARLVVRKPPPERVRLLAWWTLSLGGGTAMVFFLYAGAQWQQDIRTLLGDTALTPYHSLAIVTIALLLAAAVIAVARTLRGTARWLALGLTRLVPPQVAAVLGMVLVLLASAVLARAVVYGGLLHAANVAFSDLNNETRPGHRAPTNPLLAGSYASLVPWASLGRTGRNFVSSAPTVRELTAFNDRPATQPIRTYVGLASAPTLSAEAALAVRELERVGAFQRKVLLVVTSTGTGWVDSNAVAALEYLYNGDVATVSMQYSYLPSWISFLVDRQRAERAGQILFDAVYERWRRIPAAVRPKLLVFGVSLGAYGSQAAFSGVDDLVRRTDGALWEGTPNSATLWQSLVAGRDPGSREILPAYDRGATVRFGGTWHDLARPDTRWRTPRVVYLQHASDPVVWWSPSLILHKPDWLAERRGADVSPAMRWYPFVTFLQVTADLAWTTSISDVHGHDYQTAAAGAWPQIAPVAGWSVTDTNRLERVLADRPRF